MNMPTINHWVGGAEFEGTSDRLADVFNPALGVATKQVRLASTGDLDSAVAVAKKAFESWSTMSMTKRVAILFSFRELLEARKHELAEIITSEHGKVLSDALGEITRGPEVVEFACGLPHMLKGEYSLNASTNVDVYSLLQPLGVVSIVSPFNFPAMVPMWFFPVAIAAGNTVILKPSEKDPSASMWVANLWKEAGLPDGVFNVVHGDKVSVDGLLEHPDVESLSFVGSTPIAQYVYEKGAANGKRVQALGGAKNHMLVLPDANLDLAADSAVNAGFGSAGERCMAISVVVAVDPIGDDLVNAISEKMSKIVVGDGTRSCDMGPLVTQVHRDKVASYLDIATQDGATIVQDGRGVTPDGDENGFWLGPTLIDNVPTTSKVYQEEIFGPVLSVVRVKTYDEAIALINSGAFGNGTAIFTNDGGAARQFVTDIQVGMVGVNVPIPVPMAYFSFGGWKHSLFGDSRAHGEEGFRFFTRQKVVTSRWSDPSHGGLNLGFPQT
jgi:malonate-semialdehyde dehydrogenase (acetylating)/methylmalonate-semialdehyde dehydrogenase